MCLAIPGKLIQIDGRRATVQYPGETRQVLLTDDIKAIVGDYVLVQMGVVIKKITPKEAKLAINSWQKL